MNIIYQLTKLTVILGIGILVGQTLYISYNTTEYIERCKPHLHTPLKAPQSPQPLLEVEEVEYEDWLNYRAE